MRLTTNVQEVPTDPIEVAVVGVRAAAVSARELDYGGLAATLEDLATVLAALPRQDGRRVAQALMSGARRG